ncbi:MAG TPA: hypothetical protein DCL77_08610 [Prolixibacteraceae bacterium]|nr:hypothetical protein [Prolixibacteraceae bacterium]
MTSTKLLLLFLLSFFFCYISNAQIIINEISNKNSGQIADENNEFDDWIELYNASPSAVNLAGYYLSDDSLNFEKWAFPSYMMPGSNHMIVFASSKNRTDSPESYHWVSPVLPQHTFDYTVATASSPSNWMKPDFIPTGWGQGKAGFGFGDNDDATVIPTVVMAVYIRKSFVLPAGFSYKDIALHVDYDDGFVAYLNGVEIGRKFINGVPTWNSGTTTTHEALMYSGGKPEKITIDTAKVRSLLITGENVFAIEVHNNISSSTDLSLIPYLSFKVTDLQASSFDPTPSTLISAGTTNLHTNFKIDGKGEKIYLFNKKANTKETVWVKDLSAGWSLGRITDGAQTWGVFIQPTPRDANITKAYSTLREPEPLFSVAEGFYTTKQTVSLSTPSLTADIRYTIDGSEPTTASTRYNGIPIVVATTGLIRAACFSQLNNLPSRSVANTYFITTTGHTIPVLSIITNNSNLYGSTGIFDHSDEEWERPCYVEYFDKDKKKIFEQFSGIQIDGGAGGSRGNAQHSFRLEFNNKAYGEGDVDYTLIPDRPNRKDYKSIYLRNGSNQWLTFQFKDAMECKIMSNKTNNDYSRCTPAVVYINGAYFGVYELREKMNDEYFEENYKATVDSTFHLLSLSYYYKSILRALNGSVDTFTTDYNKFINLNPTSADYLQKADQILDLDYYTDYIVAQSFIADTDWPYNNIKIVKGDFSNHRWRFLLQDLEWALSPNGWTNSSFDHISFMLNYDASMPYLRFWKELIKNPTYKKKFINRFADLMNSSYLPQNTTAIAQSVYDASYAEMRGEYVKWGGGETQATTNMTKYASNLALFKSELNNRSNVVRTNIVSNFALTGKYTIELQVQPENAGVVQINTISPEVYPWTGVYFAGVPIKMEAKAMGDYVFDGWEPNAFIKDVNNPVVDADVKINGYKFIAKFRKVVPEQAITISEINYNSSVDLPASDWIELYNFGQTAMDISGWYITDSDRTHKWVIPGTVSVLPGNRLVLASNKAKFSAVYPNIKNVLGSFEFGLGTPSDSVQLFDSSNKLIAGVKYSSDLPWATDVNGTGKTLELKDPSISLNLSANWFAGCIGGSPGAAYAKCIIASTATVETFTPKLYPNPASDQVTIVLPSTFNAQKVTCRIFDTMGKEMRTEALDPESENILKYAVAGFPQGIYIVQLSNGSFQQNLKFVKQ